MWLSVPMAPSIQAIPQTSNAASEPITQAKAPSTPEPAYQLNLLYSEAFASKPEALSAEALFKKKKPRKKELAYIKEHTENNRRAF